MLHPVFGYLLAIFDHWLFSWGAIGLLVVAMIEKLRDRPISKKWFFVAACVCLVIAMFQAWNDENEKRGTLLSANESLIRENQKLQQEKEKLVVDLQGDKGKFLAAYQLDKDKLLAELARKEHPVVIEVPHDPEIGKILQTYQNQLGKLTNQTSSLRSQALRVSTDILMFLSERQRGEPTFSPPPPVEVENTGDFPSAIGTIDIYRTNLQRNHELERYHEALNRYTRETLADYEARFALRVNKLIQDLRTSGIDARMAENYCSSVDSSTVLKNCAVTLGNVANTLPE